MSSYNAGPCGICGAESDYCHLETAAGPSIDCRDLQLKYPDDIDRITQMAADMNDQTDDDHRSHGFEKTENYSREHE